MRGGEGTSDGISRRQRVLFVSHEATRTGAPIMFLHFLRWVREHTSLDFEILLLDGGSLVEEFEALGPVHLVKGRGAAALPYIEAGMARAGFHRSSDQMRMSRLRSEARGLRGFDAIYMNSTTSALALRILPEIPPVVFSHIHELDAAFTYWFPQPERDAMLAHTHWYVACAEAVASYLIGHQGVAPERVSCHYEFIDLPRADPDRAAALRESLGIGPKSLVVGGSGLKIWRKAPDLFLQAANTLVRERPDLDVHFVWVGGDAHYDQMPIERDIARMGLSGRAHFVGEVAKPADLFSTFDVFCLTSREDPFPLVMLEAASLGVPIVSFPNGGAMELAGYQDGDPDHRRAVIVDYLDTDAMARAVTHLLDDAEEREVLGKRGQQWVELEHTVDAAGPRLYEAIMSRLGGRGPDANDGPLPGDEPPVDALQLTEQHRHFAGLRADRWALRR